MNKKGKWEWDYNVQTIVDEYKVIILSSYITQNPTDHFELIPSIEQLKTNLDGIYEELPSNFQFSPDNGYSTDENTTCIEEKGLDGYISTRKLSRKEKKYNLWEKPFQKDNFYYNTEIESLYLPFRWNIISKKNIRIQKQTKNNLPDKQMQKIHHERNLLQEKELQNNSRLWKPF